MEGKFVASFTKELLEHFNAEKGAFSTVTYREATGDKSVTLDSYEKDVIFEVYQPTSFIRKGGLLSIKETEIDIDKKEFLFYKNNEDIIPIKLAVVFPKRKGKELRLYFSKSYGFVPNSGDIWFIYISRKQSLPYIGFMNETSWSKLTTETKARIVLYSLQILDEEDEIYQNRIGAAEVKLPTTLTTQKYPRNPKVALNALQAAGYVCEGSEDHYTFKSVTGRPYLECHHLIPVSLQHKFEVGLDVEENIVALCPSDHRLLHYGVGEDKVDLLKKLWELKHEGLMKRGINITIEEFLSIYIK
jgi:5-methylcytosine-specific restriction enzyme A